MRIECLKCDIDTGWQRGTDIVDAPQIVFYFGVRQVLSDGARFAELKAIFPHAHIVGCSTGGHIQGDDINDDIITAVALSFSATEVRIASTVIDNAGESSACGRKLGQALWRDNLSGLFVLSDGLTVNGSELVDGINSALGKCVPVTGGLAGDGPAFEETLVGGDAPPAPKTIVAVGFYGSAVMYSTGSAGGWDVFGPRRQITNSKGNVLYGLDDEAALDLYERYLGEEAKELPGSALLFPLQIYDPANPDHGVVRTVLAIDRDAKSMTFAGDVPKGWTAQLMRGNIDRLSAGAAGAARQAAFPEIADGSDTLALMVSCIGRRLLMGQRVTDEIEAVGDEFGPDVVRAGFYSYGELCPHAASGASELHNQTMTITLISEAA